MARPPQDPQIRIAEILDAAEPLFYANGYHETAISDIVKKMGVAQGTLYYYFKSKEEILEALINRHMSTFTSAFEPIINSDSIAPLQKIEFVIQSIFRTIHYKEGLLFDFLYDDRTLHLVDKLSRQGKQLVAPFLLKFIEEGKQQHYFHVSHPKAALNLILAILDCLIDAIYEKSPDDLLSCQFKLAEQLMAKALGMQEGTIRIFINDL